MHEISLVRTISNTLEAEFSAEELNRLQKINLRVGLLSNVQPVLMQNAFNAVREAEDKFHGVTLNIELLPVIVKCEICAAESQIDNYKFSCGNCNRPTSNVIQGNELLIHQVEFSDPVSGEMPV